MKKMMGLTLICCFSQSFAGGPPSQIISDPKAISAFLKSPGTKIYDLTVPKDWKNPRQYLEIGQPVPGGGCRFSHPSQLSQGGNSIMVEMAGDKTACKSLMLEGSPDDATFERIRRSLH